MIAANVTSEQADLLRRKGRGIEELELLVQGLCDLIASEREEFLGLLNETLGRPNGSVYCGARPCKASVSGACVYEFTPGNLGTECLFCGRPAE